MCLAAAAIEAAGIPTVAIQLLLDVARKIRPPRALFVPFRHGYPLGAAGDTALQRKVIRAALKLLESSGSSPPLLAEFPPIESGS